MNLTMKKNSCGIGCKAQDRISRISSGTSKRFWMICVLVLLVLPLAGQSDSAGMVKYSPGFRFSEGLYLNFDQVKQNRPVPKSGIITTVPYDDPDFYDRILREKVIGVFDNLGTKQEVSTRNIWGYSRNGVLYVNLNEGYYRITVVGTICHFVASLTTYSNSYNPYYSAYGYPYYGNSYYNPYNPYYSPYNNTSNSEMRQYLLDFKNGNILDYEVESLKVLLMADPELHDEYASLGKKKQKQMKFLYIRKFNERNPLYFPNNP